MTGTKRLNAHDDDSFHIAGIFTEYIKASANRRCLFIMPRGVMPVNYPTMIYGERMGITSICLLRLTSTTQYRGNE